MMPRSLSLAGLTLLAAVTLPTAVLAQAQTGTGGGPTSTVTAPHTSTVGRTMPPSSGAAGAATADDRRQRTPQQAQDDRISRGICIGCGPK